MSRLGPCLALLVYLTLLALTTRAFLHQPVSFTRSLSASSYNLSQVVSSVNLQNFAFFYLQNELQVSERALMRIVLKYSYILYLRPERTIIPTIEVFQSFGFTQAHVRTMVEKVPPLLSINHNWTLPEKLLSLQTCFHLNQDQLIRVCVEVPFVLTSSIQRNLEILEFLQLSVSFSSQEITRLVCNRPQILTTSLSTLKICWAVLTDVYGFSNSEARNLIRKTPSLLSKALVKKQREKVLFFSNRLNLPPPFSEIQILVKRYPRLLTLDLDYFIHPNVQLLEHYLGSYRDAVPKMIRLHPSLLFHNPTTLESRLIETLHFLTGNDSYRNCKTILEHSKGNIVLRMFDEFTASERYPIDNENEDDVNEIMDDVIEAFQLELESASSLEALTEVEFLESKDNENVDSQPEELFPDPVSSVNLDLIFDIVYSHIDGETASLFESGFSEGLVDAQSTQTFYEMSRRLCLPETKALSVCCSVPWILSYRPERNHRVVSSLAVSLGMTQAEVSKCVGTYPRLLCLSVEGKISAVLRFLAFEASEWLSMVFPNRPKVERLAFLKAHSIRMEKDLSSTFSNNTNMDAVIYRRGNLIRSLVRAVLVRYPNILGTSMEKIALATEKLRDSQLPFEKILKFLRKTSPKPSKASSNKFDDDLDVVMMD